MKHGLNTDEPQSRKGAEPGEGRDADVYKWEKAVANRGFYRIGTRFCRINGEGDRLLPLITASYRIMFCWEMEWRSIGVLGSGGCEIMREKLRVVTHFSAVFHDFPHRSGP